MYLSYIRALSDLFLLWLPYSALTKEWYGIVDSGVSCLLWSLGCTLNLNLAKRVAYAGLQIQYNDQLCQCFQVIPIDNKGQLKEAFNIRPRPLLFLL
jgi:hypothetical protein